MRQYFIKTKDESELEKVMEVLGKFKLEEVKNLKVEKAIVGYKNVEFKCDKIIWKQVKKELNLEISSVFASFGH